METLITALAIVIICGVCLLLASLVADPDENLDGRDRVQSIREDS